MQDLQQVMVSGPNLNETSIVSGGYGGTAEGIIPTGSIKGTASVLPELVCLICLSQYFLWILLFLYFPIVYV